MRIRLLCLALVALACALAPHVASAQQTCQPPLPPAPAPGQNIFTPQQEMDLGDAIAEQVQHSYRVLDDNALAAELRRIGARVIKGLPDTGLKFQFFLIDAPDPDAFTLPGGRIYISRKLVAFVRSEDELASILAHELGHVASRQTAEDMTYLFREVLGVTSVGDRRDIFEKYHQLVENSARKPKAFEHGARIEEKEQLVADQLGLYALAGAGYDPAALPSFWERFTETKGKTGGFLSDLFGSTKPEEKRLREMRRALTTLPPACVAARAGTSLAAFQQWQAAVVAYANAARKEALHGVVSKIVLEPPLRGDVTYLHFSPDGRYILAQDDTGINVLTREPFALRFRIDAPEAHTAQFTPDAQSLVYHTSALRVETWSLAEGKQKEAHELVVRGGCLQSELAPDGRTLACLGTNLDVALYDVSSGAQIFQKKSFYKPSWFDLFRLRLLALVSAEESSDFGADWISMNFSPDAHYFAAGSRSISFGIGGIGEESGALLYDLTTKTTMPVRGLLKTLLTGDYAFIGPDRIVARNPQDFKKSALVSFPGGEVVEQFPLWGTPAAVTRGNYFILRPIKQYAAGVVDLATKDVFLANKLAALDVYDQFFVSERLNGELGLYRVAKTELIASLVLPRNPLGRLRATALSADMKWLAVSERSRGAIWDLTKGQRVMHVRGFRGAYFDADGALYADFPKYEGTERTLAKLDPTTGHALEGAPLAQAFATQHGPYVVHTRPAKEGGSFDENVTMEVRDTRTQAVLWSRTFPKEAPVIWISPAENTVVLAWATKTNAAKTEIQSDPNLKQRLALMKEKEGDYFLQVLDARNGQALGKLLVETGKGSFRIASVFAAGDWVVIADTENRVLIYSLARGEQQGRVFGGRATISPTTGLLAVENERGQLSTYDLATMAKRDEFDFDAPVKFARFSADGRRLFVLTANQTAYVLTTEKQ